MPSVTIPKSPTHPLPQPQLHLPPTHLVLFLALAFSFLNMAMSSQAGVGMGAEEPWTPGRGRGRRHWRREGRGPAELPWPQEVTPRPCQARDIFRQDHGAKGCQPQGQLRFPPRPLLLVRLLTLFLLALGQFLQDPAVSSVPCSEPLPTPPPP